MIQINFLDMLSDIDFKYFVTGILFDMLDQFINYYL